MHHFFVADALVRRNDHRLVGGVAMQRGKLIRQRGFRHHPFVAPGIAEALIATAMGLFSAIPAVIAYNRFTHDVDRLANRMESFMEEFSNILQRQVTSKAE